MMRHPIDTLPRQIDPWNFARNRQHCAGELPLEVTQSLKQWAIAGQSLHGELVGNIDEYGQTKLSGQISVLLEMQCQRCLHPMQSTVERDFDYVIIRSQTQEDRVEGSAEAFICAEDELDVTWFLEEEALLAMPMIAKHDDCKPPLDLTAASENADSDRQYPFLALKEMMKSKEH